MLYYLFYEFCDSLAEVVHHVFLGFVGRHVREVAVVKLLLYLFNFLFFVLTVDLLGLSIVECANIKHF